jgi:hypothetical protein
MSAGAWIMFLIGAVFLWGGLILSTLNYLRSGRSARGQ